VLKLAEERRLLFAHDPMCCANALDQRSPPGTSIKYDAVRHDVGHGELCSEAVALRQLGAVARPGCGGGGLAVVVLVMEAATLTQGC